MRAERGTKRQRDESENSESARVIKGASRTKIEMMGAACCAGDGMEQSWILAHVVQLTCLLVDVLCPDCEQTRLSVSVAAGEQAGFSSKLVLKCDGCGYCKSEMSSPRTEFSAQENVPF